MTITELQENIDKWIKTYGIRYFDIKTNTLLLVEEVGEVARIIARKHGEQSEKTSDSLKVLEDELSDVLFVLTCIANQSGIDLEKAMINNIEKKTKRDSTRHLNNKKL